MLIDSGYYDSGIKKYLMEIGGLDAILLTHGHWDHIYGLDSLKGLRRSYMWLSYVRNRAGGSVSHDLLGIDRPDEVQKIYVENEAWISEKTGI